MSAMHRLTILACGCLRNSDSPLHGMGSPCYLGVSTKTSAYSSFTYNSIFWNDHYTISMGKNESYNHADVIGTNEMDRASEDHWIGLVRNTASLRLTFNQQDRRKVPLISRCSVYGRSSFSSVAVPSRLRFAYGFARCRTWSM